MHNILFVNHKQEQCGVYQYGKRVADILITDNRYNMTYIEVDNDCEFNNSVNHINNIIIYNWHPSTMPWLTSNIVNQHKQRSKQLMIYHETYIPAHLNFDAVLMTDLSENISLKQYSLPRPLFEIDLPKTKNEKIKFGSFGFGFTNKGFEKITHLINTKYDEATVHLHIPNAYFGDPNSVISNSIINRCKDIITKPNIDLIITTEFLSNHEILKFLNDNDVNIFLYDDLGGRGLSSTIDYALSVNTPLVINNSNMFRHILSDKPGLSIDFNDIETIIKNGTEPLLHFRAKWSNKELRDKFIKIINEI